jgi:hypothetical protein
MPPDMHVFGNLMQIVVGSTACFIVIGLVARILWRVGSNIRPRNAPATSLDRDDRLYHLETAVDTIAIEVERISEAQRFVVGLLSESNQLKRGERADRNELPLPNSASRTPGQTNTPH